jgi:hypothetical protein
MTTNHPDYAIVISTPLLFFPAFFSSWLVSHLSRFWLFSVISFCGVAMCCLLSSLPSSNSPGVRAACS